MQNNRKNRIPFCDLGLIDYKEAWDLQEKTLEEVVKQKQESGKRVSTERQVIYLCEHPHVYTLGKSGKNKNLLIPDELLEKISARVYRINRGGDITYHGPGQLVGYPILNLK